MNNSRATSISFTVDDDLISESSLNTTHRTIMPKNPFGRQYGVSPQQQQQISRKLQQRAENDAYKQLNSQLYNPFEHKLGQNFIPKQDHLYQQQKRRQLELIKKRQQQKMNTNKNYTIIFNNNNNNQAEKNILQNAGKNLVNADDVNPPKISDYYEKKFSKKKKTQEIDMIGEEDNDDEEMNGKKDKNTILNNSSNNKEKKVNSVKKVDNFLRSTKKIQKKSAESEGKLRLDDENKKQPEVLKKRVSQNIVRKSNSIEKKIQNKSKEEPTNVSKQFFDSSEDSLSNLDFPTKKIAYQQEVPKKPIENKRTPVNKTPQLNNRPDNLPPQPPKKPQVPTFSKGGNPNNGKQPNKNIKNGKNKKDGERKKYADVYEGPDRNLVQQLERELTECPTISFDDIAELDTAKNLLQQAVLLPRLMPQFFQGIRRATKGILLFGPPGTGKTLLAKAIAKDNIFLNVSAASLASKWKGQSQKMVRLLFQIAKHYSPSVIFFDQIDAIGSKRSENEHESNRKVKTQLLVQMDGVGSENNQIVVLAASNRPWDLDEALRRRLEKRIYIPLPGKQGRKKMFQINLKGLNISSKINWDKLVEMTKGHSGADICNVCRDAAYMPMRRKIQQIGGIQKLQQLKQTDIIDEQLSQNDLLEAAKKVKASVGKEDLKRYESWMAQFGSS